MAVHTSQLASNVIYSYSYISVNGKKMYSLAQVGISTAVSIATVSRRH